MKLYNRKKQDTAPLAQADPYILKGTDGRYYLYATEGQVYSSDCLLSGWRYEGIRLQMPGQHTCWAPSVIEQNGIYYMYYSSIDDGAKEEHGHALRVAISSSPAGPFLYEKTLLPPFSIDAHTVETPSGLYLFYCQNEYGGERPGTRIFCDKMQNPLTLCGEPRCVVWPTLDEEIYQRDRYCPGRHWHTIEGAFYFFHEGVHFLMYSGACYLNPTYFIGYCTAEGREDADLRLLEWKKYPDEHTYAPLLTRNELAEGLGHNSVLYEAGKYYIVYHARDYEDSGKKEDTRTARIDELLVEGKRLRVRRIL